MDIFCIYIISPYIIIGQGKKEYPNIKSVTMIDDITAWFEITQYDGKRVINTENVVDTM